LITSGSACAKVASSREVPRAERNAFRSMVLLLVEHWLVLLCQTDYPAEEPLAASRPRALAILPALANIFPSLHLLCPLSLLAGLSEP
jgi:hypothetical protein